MPKGKFGKLSARDQEYSNKRVQLWKKARERDLETQARQVNKARDTTHNAMWFNRGLSDASKGLQPGHWFKFSKRFGGHAPNQNWLPKAYKLGREEFGLIKSMADEGLI